MILVVITMQMMRLVVGHLSSDFDCEVDDFSFQMMKLLVGWLLVT